MRACLPATQKSRTYLQHTPTIVRVHEKFWNGTGAINHDLSEGEVRETKKERVKEKFVHVLASLYSLARKHRAWAKRYMDKTNANKTYANVHAHADLAHDARIDRPETCL